METDLSLIKDEAPFLNMVMFGREQKFYHGFLETEASNDPGKGQQQLN
jgi:hypothetical protein